MFKLGKLAIAASLMMTATPASAGFIVSYEAAGQTSSTAGFDYFGVETFDNRLGQSDFTSSFTHEGTTIELSYSGVQVRGGDAYGGVEGSNYAAAGLHQGERSYSIDIATDGADGVNYFGYWLSALDGGNSVSFYDNDALVFAFSADDVLELLSGMPAYWGNPFTGQNGHEPYVFLNFFYEGGTFDRVVFSQANGSAGYESDNHTIGFYNSRGDGTPITPVPEPAAIGLLGMGLVGLAALRRRKR